MPVQEKPGQDLLNTPLGDTLAALAGAIADAQAKFDTTSYFSAEFMSGYHPLRDPKSGEVVTSPDGLPQMIDSRVTFGTVSDDGGRPIAQKLSMMELGFTPKFYKFVDTVIEMHLSIRIHRTDEQLVVTTSPVDAAYAASYGFGAKQSASLMAKIVPIPPPPIQERLIALLAEETVEDFEIGNRFGEAEFDLAQFSAYSEPRFGQLRFNNTVFQ